MSRITRREFLRTAGGFVTATVLAPELMARAEARTKRFNILLLMTDQHHHGVMGCAGNPVVKTPTIDRLASEGARFTHATCVTPFCSPSRASLVTGLWPHTHGIVQNVNGNDPGLTDSAVTTEQILFDRQNETFQMGKWHLGDPADLRCYRKERERVSAQAYSRFLKDAPREKWAKPRAGEVTVGDVSLIPEMAPFHSIWKDEMHRSAQDLSIIGRSLRPPECHYESWLADRCIEMIKQYRDRNFMITWSVSPPHPLWVVPDPYYSMYDPAKMPLPRSFGDHPQAYADSQPGRMGRLMGEKLIREYLRCYYGQLTMMDALTGRILDALRQAGQEQDTLVIFTSDHGDMQGAHGMPCKSLPAFYDEIVRIPLIMRYPRAIKRGTVLNAHASLLDLMPTILDYAGVPIPKQAQGVSLRSLIEGRAYEDDRPAYCERGKDAAGWSRMIRTKRWKYVVFGERRRELFDLKRDPYEMRNLAAEPAQRDVVRRLHQQLSEHMEQTADPALSLLPKA